MSVMVVKSSMGDRKLYGTGVTAQHLSRDPQYGTRCALKFRVATRQGKSESQSVEFSLDRADAVKLREQLDAFLAIRQEPSRQEQAISLVLALHDNPTANVPGYLVKLDPMAEAQLRAAL